MSALAGASTIINLVIATGPFSYPYEMVKSGFIPSIILMAITMIIGYMTATFMIESISVACAKRYKGRQDTLFPLIQGENVSLKETRDKLDLQVKDSPFYIRQKLEIGNMAEDFIPKWGKYVLYFVLVLYMYGAMCLKYIAGAESLAEGVSATFFNDKKELKDKMGGFDPYYIAIIIFAALSIYFSFGNIENSKILQIVTTVLRFFTTFLMILGSIISLFKSNGGVTTTKKFFAFDFDHFDELFGGTIFIFI